MSPARSSNSSRRKPGRAARRIASLAKRAPIVVAETTIEAGRAAQLEIPIARMPAGAWVTLPVKVIHGRREGPTVWLSGAVHGDEINGVEITRRLIGMLKPSDIRGTLIGVPIVNVFGFTNGSRYLPDRRDLNRSFPGSPRGSLAARLAHLFLTEIVDRCGYGIDFHTGAHHRTNLAQVRAALADPETLALATAFGAPIAIDAKTRDGSLREAAAIRGAKVLLYEGGEPHRFSRQIIEGGVEGTLRVLQHLGMISDAAPAAAPTLRSDRTQWVRARRSGILWLTVQIGDHVEKGQRLGTISDAFGEGPAHVTAPISGLVVGTTRNPLTSQGDGIVHIAEITGAIDAARTGDR